MILPVILVIVGLLRKQQKRYWAAAAIATGVHFLAGVLFSGGGTLENPAGDGLVTAAVRRATNDGPAVVAMLVPALAFAWAVPLWLIRRAYVPAAKRAVAVEVAS